MTTRETSTNGRRGRLGLGLLAAAAIAAPQQAAVAQDAPTLFLDVSTGLSYENYNDRDSETELTTRLGVGLFTSTSNQRLSFETGVTARAREDGHGFVDPYADIAYARFSRNAEIGARLTYRAREIEGAVIDDDFDTEDLDREDGTREDIGVRLSLVTGRFAPFGTETELRYDERNFTDGAASDDERIHSAESTLFFRVDPRIEFSLTGQWRQQETLNFVNEVDTVRRVTAGADLEIDQLWSARVALGYAQLDTETIAGLTREEGIEGDFVLTRDLPNGRLAFSVDHVVTDDGWRNSVRLRRLFEVSEIDRLNLSIGQIFFEEGGNGHLASADFTRRLRFSTFRVGFDYRSDLDGADLLVQRARVNFAMTYDLTDNSSLGLDAALASVQYDNPFTVDGLRADAGISYLYGLSNDWNLVARMQHRVLYQDGDVDERSNRLSLNLERRFSVRP
jgi:hypothetical protein